MDNLSSISSFSPTHRKQGFTLIEIMVSIAIVAIMTTIALPSLNTFIVKMRVDNEISELQRLLLTARNLAINTGKNTTVCPLAGNACTTNWQNQISVFTNDDNLLATSNTYALPDELIKIKNPVKAGDRLQYAQTSVIYAPTGRLITPAASFRYCPKDEADRSRGIDVSVSGRTYISSDIDDDDKDEDRTGAEILCI